MQQIQSVACLPAEELDSALCSVAHCLVCLPLNCNPQLCPTLLPLRSNATYLEEALSS